MTTQEIAIRANTEPYVVFLVADVLSAVKASGTRANKMLRDMPHLWVGTYSKGCTADMVEEDLHALCESLNRVAA